MHPFVMLRRSYNYDYDYDYHYGFDSTRLHDDHTDDHSDGPAHGGHAAYDAGLPFTTYNADPDTHFIPAQRQLATNGLTGRFMTPTGSGIFALPPGLARATYVGEYMFT